MFLLGRRNAEQRRQDALLCEYQTGQILIASLEPVSWQSTGVLWGAAIAGIAIIIGTANESAKAAIGVTGLAVGVIVLLELWRRIWLRERATLNAAQRRMRGIERQLGMQMNIRMNILSHWNQRLGRWREVSFDWREILGPNDRRDLQEDEPLPPPRGAIVVEIIGRLIQGGWATLIAWQWLIHTGVLD